MEKDGKSQSQYLIVMFQLSNGSRRPLVVIAGKSDRRSLIECFHSGTRLHLHGAMVSELQPKLRSFSKMRFFCMPS
jgi:hypothetical protein